MLAESLAPRLRPAGLQNHKAVRCHFMLSDPIINKELMDGIHPTQAACTKLGKAAYELMAEEGMRR